MGREQFAADEADGGVREHGRARWSIRRRCGGRWNRRDLRWLVSTSLTRTRRTRPTRYSSCRTWSWSAHRQRDGGDARRDGDHAAEICCGVGRCGHCRTRSQSGRIRPAGNRAIFTPRVLTGISAALPFRSAFLSAKECRRASRGRDIANDGCRSTRPACVRALDSACAPADSEWRPKRPHSSLRNRSGSPGDRIIGRRPGRGVEWDVATAAAVFWELIRADSVRRARPLSRRAVRSRPRRGVASASRPGGYCTAPRQGKSLARHLTAAASPFIYRTSPAARPHPGGGDDFAPAAVTGYVFLYADHAGRAAALASDRVAHAIAVHDQPRLCATCGR